jgi:hypothetical protein
MGYANFPTVVRQPNAPGVYLFGMMVYYNGYFSDIKKQATYGQMRVDADDTDLIYTTITYI